MRYVGENRASINQLLHGKTIAEVWRNGACLLIKCTDGFQITIGWKDPETGEPIKGEPVIVQAGTMIVQSRRPDLLHGSRM